MSKTTATAVSKSMEVCMNNDRLSVDPQPAEVRGMLYNLRDMGGFAFLVLRVGDSLLQCVYDKQPGEALHLLESALSLKGEFREEPRAMGGRELIVSRLTMLSSPKEEPPLCLNKQSLNIALEHEIPLRPLTLRNQRLRSVFKLQEGLVRGMRRHLEDAGFTEIFSPKIVASGAEGGANIFKLDYFGKPAYLAQSPQFYKQLLVPVYGRVFEMAPVFRAEKHDTARHLNEYISVDFEMGFIDSFYDIIAMETTMLRAAFAYLSEHYAPQLTALKLTLPEIPGEIPCLRFQEAKERVSAKYGRKIRDPYDLEPEEERLIGQLAKEEYGSEFVFVTHYPTKKRPFYAMDDPEDPKYTLSFDLLFRGLEVTTGGQRIHDYDTQVAKMEAKGLDPAAFSDYLLLHKHGCPPHGGLGMGLERLVMQLLGEKNIRATSMFPRDTLRLTP